MTKTLTPDLLLHKLGTAGDDAFIDFRIWNADFGFKVFCLFYQWIERSDTANLKSQIQNYCIRSGQRNLALATIINRSLITANQRFSGRLPDF